MDTDYSKPHEENEEGLKANHRSNLQGKFDFENGVDFIDPLMSPSELAKEK